MTVPSIAVLIPCFNEAGAIAGVIGNFRVALPSASIYVYDNDSTDDTAQQARAAGAIVRHEPLRGKGNVVRRMFADVDADVLVLVDGDGTYDANSAPAMVNLLIERHLDMVCARREEVAEAAYRQGHRTGNRVLTRMVGALFGGRLTDILSGYRVLSRRFVKSFPALSSGFEIETELTVHALDLRAPIAELATPYRERAAGSSSKLSTWSDGWRIMRTILRLLKEERPLAFFGSIGALFALSSIAIAFPLLREYLDTGQVPRFPTAILAVGMMLVAAMSFVCGLILDTVTRGRRELKRMHYLQHTTAMPRDAART